MSKFPVDAPIEDVIRAFVRLGFQIVRKGNHIAMSRKNVDGSTTPLTIPNHRRIKGSTLRTIITQAGITREDFLSKYEE